jgi:parvulin-like peptidyl-prolyl isomerase
MKRPLHVLLLALLLAGPAFARLPPLAFVDGEPITGEDLRDAFARRHSGHLAFLASELEVRKFLEKLIDWRLLIHEAERLDLADRPEVLELIADKLDALTFGHLLKLEIEAPAQPTEEEIRAAFERHTAELVQVRQVVVASRPEIEEIAKLLAQGRTLAELARERSQAPSRRSDGLLMPIGWGTMEETWDEAVFRLKPGEVSRPFRNGGAWEIVQMLDRKPVERPRYEKAREKLRSILLRRKLETRQRDFSAQLHKKFGVAVRLVPDDPAKYAAALHKDPQTIVAAWKGGELRIEQLAQWVDFGALQGLDSERAAEDLESMVHLAINEQLARLEARERRYEKLPEIQAEVQRLREGLMENILLAEYVFKDIAVADAEIRAWYGSHQAELTAPERRRLSHILLPAKEAAQEVRERLVKGEPFEQLLKLSQDASSLRSGGELGWITAEDTPEEFKSVLSLAKDEISLPIRSKFGWHIVRVVQIEPPRKRDFDEVKEDLRQKLLLEKRKAERTRWIGQLRAAAEITVNEAAVRRFVSEAASKEPAQAPESHGMGAPASPAAGSHPR